MNVEELIRFVSELAAKQHGLVQTVQIPEVDQRRFRHLARRGLLQRVGTGVYRATASPVTWQQQIQGAVWALGPTAVVSHASAARLHGFDRFEGDAIEVTTDRSARGKAPADIKCTVHTSMSMPKADVVRFDELPVTSATRTIIDLARDRTSTNELEAAIDSAVRLRLTTLDLIADRVGQVTGPARWGLARLDDLLATSGGHTMLERRFLQLVRSAGLPMPTPQAVHRVAGRHVARVDFLFQPQDVVVEVSGGRGHSSPRERAKDARRRNELQQMGRVVLEFTYEHVTQQSDLVVATLRVALGLPVAA